MKPNATVAIALVASTPVLAETAPASPVKPDAPAPVARLAELAAPIDINSATVAEIAAVEGLSWTLAKAIVKNRPYQSTDELLKSRILTESLFTRVCDSLTVARG
jgi:DNA uptake protein ComE-like DNA-binding protein